MTDFSDIHLILKKISENQAASQVELALQREKTEEEFRKLIAQQAEFEKQLVESHAKRDIQQAKTDAQQAKTDARLDKMIAQQERNNKKMGGIVNNMGSTVEEYFYYALEETKKLGNIQFDDIELNLKGRTRSVQDEFDIVLYNGDAVGIVEIKYKVHPNDLDNLVDKKVEHFRALFPDYKDFQIYLGIGGYSIPETVASQAKSFGVAVLRQKGEIIEIEGDKLRAY